MSKEVPKNKRTRKSIPLDKKIEILDRLLSGEGCTSLARSFGMNESTIRTIRKNEENIRRSVASGSIVSSKFSSYRRDNAMEVMEKALIIWIEDYNQKRIPIDSIAIRQKAIRIYNQIKEINEAITSENNKHEFCGSKGWFENFKRRYALHNLKIKGEIASADDKAAKKFPSELQRIIEERSYVPDQVFNADETGLFWKKMPRKTYLAKAESIASGFKVAKDRITFLFCSNASGNLLMKPLLINRALKPRAMKGINISNLPVHWMANKKAWVTATVFTEWFYNCFVPEAEQYMREKNLPFKVLLLVDNAPGHPQYLHHPNVQVVFLPPNTTSLIQPLDQGIIATFKTYYIKHSFKNVLRKLDENESLTLTEVWKNFTIFDCVTLAAVAFREIRKSTLNSCWKAIWPEVVQRGNAVPTTEEEIIQIVDLAHRIGGEGLDYMDTTDIAELLTDTEINEVDLIDMVTKTNESNIEITSESDLNEPDNFSAKHIGEALQLAQKLESAILKIDPNVERALKFQRELKNCCAQYEEIQKNLAEKEKQILITQTPKTTDNGNDDDSDGSIIFPIKKKRMIVIETSDE